MQTRILSLGLFLLALAVSHAQEDRNAARAALQQQIAQLQNQLAPLEQLRKDRDAAFENISVVNPADLVAINTKYKAAQEQFGPIEKQLSDLQATLRLLESQPNPNLGTQNPARQRHPVPPGSDDPDQLLGNDGPVAPNPPQRHNLVPYPPGHDLDIDLDLDPASGHGPSSHGPSGHTPSPGHSDGSGRHSDPAHSGSGHSSSGHDTSDHSSSGHDNSGHSGSGHSSSGHSSSGHPSPSHSGSGHSGSGEPPH